VVHGQTRTRCPRGVYSEGGMWGRDNGGLDGEWSDRLDGEWSPKNSANYTFTAGHRQPTAPAVQAERADTRPVARAASSWSGVGRQQ